MCYKKIVPMIFVLGFSLFYFCGTRKAQDKNERPESGLNKTTVDTADKNVKIQSADTAFSLMKSESIGQIKIGLIGDSLIKRFGQPDSMGATQMSEASGAYVQKWEYRQAGMKLEMESPDSLGQKHVASIEAVFPCTLSTKKGIKIGSQLADVEKEYGDFEDKENGEGKTNTSFVAGSIYGGIIFSLENEKVTKIFIGASAE
jgi:hypothetical protein